MEKLLVVTVFVLGVIAIGFFNLNRLQTHQDPKPQVQTSATTNTIVAVGDISCNSSQGIGNECKQDQVATLVKTINPQLILLLGDIQYQDGKLEDFFKYFDKSWGDLKGKIRPAPGNHEYHTTDAAGYFSYFPEYKGQNNNGYYSLDWNNWHIMALNSNCSSIGGCKKDSQQYKWLFNDLKNSNKKCQLAFWHEPLYSSGLHGDSTTMQEIFNLLYDNKVELVLNGHDHIYNRIQKADGFGNPQNDGVRSFVVGTGGRNLYPFLKPSKLSVAKQNSEYGVLKLGLHKDSYTWEFVSINENDFKDFGEGVCDSLI